MEIVNSESNVSIEKLFELRWLNDTKLIIEDIVFGVRRNDFILFSIIMLESLDLFDIRQKFICTPNVIQLVLTTKISLIA